MARRSRQLHGTFTGLEAGGAVFVGVMATLAALAAWPMYLSSGFVVVVIAAVAAALVLAALAHRQLWSVPVTASWAAGALVALGLTTAVPLWRDGFVRSVALFFAGLVTSWKDLVTVDLPAGEYRNLLVPVLVVFLFATLAGLLLSWQRSKAAVAAVAVMLALQWFALVFGSSAPVLPTKLGPLAFAAPRQAALGLLGLLASLAWLTWRARRERSGALHRAALASGVELARPRTGAMLRSAGLGTSLVVGAVVLGLIGAPVLLSARQRQVLRSGVGPQMQMSKAVSPLVGYRANFVDAAYDQTLFAISSSGRLPDRVRLATLNSYDDEVFSASGSSYRRVAYQRDPGAGDRVRLHLSAGDLGTLWLPTAGSLAGLSFTGARAQELSDGFYYDPSSGAGVDTVAGGLASGDGYDAEVALTDPPSVAELTSPQNSPQFAAPESLQRWVKTQGQSGDGAGLAELAKRLVERGYLSHALSEATPTPNWITDLGADYTFRASASGHSNDRLAEMFDSLNARQDAAGPAPTPESLVAAVGDDEQFAVAIALVADQLGYTSRVVVGARLGGDATGVAPCADGVCRGKNLSAWTEVQGADGRWAVIEATPQHLLNPDQKKQTRRDPQNKTEVRPIPADEVEPPDSGGGKGNNTDSAAGLNLAWLWVGLRVIGIVLLSLAAVLGPFGVVVGAKLLRRRSRRKRSAAALSIAGAWDELVDAKIDRGAIVLEYQTRSEAASQFADQEAERLAEGADWAVFAGVAVNQDEVDDYWREVEAYRRQLAERETAWQRVLAAISLASFVRPDKSVERRWRFRALKSNG